MNIWWDEFLKELHMLVVPNILESRFSELLGEKQWMAPSVASCDPVSVTLRSALGGSHHHFQDF